MSNRDWSQGRAPVKIGDRIKITGVLPKDPHPPPVGTLGTVDWLNTFIDELTSQIGVRFDHGGRLNLLPGDPFIVLPKGSEK